jgi:two-component system sensor histidine kinase CpxA
LIVALGLLRHASPDDAPEYVARIEQEAERLDKMIGQLLTLTRIESGVELAQRETFDLTNLVHEVAADGDFEARARRREVKIVHADNCTMSGASEMLRSAIENVVRNAIRHTLEGTSVELNLKRQRADGSEKALLEIRDHGPGVPKWMLSEIFLPFHRVPDQAESATQGAGLGLAIADRVVRMHQGSIRALNASDGGLIVEMLLPISG